MTQTEPTAATQVTQPDQRLAKLNQFTRRAHTLDEVYLFDVKLCDNEIDRDGERFTRAALEQLKTLFVGRTGIFDHNPKGENQSARLYDTEIVEEPQRLTTAGEPYAYLKGHAYMIRTDANRDLIREIEGGIKKEVSISCAAGAQTCSVCGKDRRKSPCRHRLGQTYGDSVCHILLSDITDAYEWSFVAIPAQREAGVTKQFGQDGADQTHRLSAQLAQSRHRVAQAEAMMRQDIIRLRYLVGGKVEQDAVAKAVETMELEALFDLRERLRTSKRETRISQLIPPDSAADNGAYQL